MKFSELNLPAPLLRAVEDLGFETPTDIQAQALPHLLNGFDVAGQAQTGTGKSACFLLAVLDKLLQSEPMHDGSPRALIVAPTRELAIQIAADAESLSTHTDIRIALAYGGTNWEKQARTIQEGIDIIVGTPGRLIDFQKRRVLQLGHVECLVIDEADRMFDMGFIRDIQHLIRACPPKDRRQSLLFSATLSQQVMQLAWRHMVEPVEIAIEPERPVVEAIDQSLYHVSGREKVPVLLGLLHREAPNRAIIFVNTRRAGEELTWRLNHNGYQAVYMSGDIAQNKRLKILEAYKAGDVGILVATDVASRGLHVTDVTHVFNYDIPQDPEDYVHRIGRTARAGAKGRAISLACERFVYGLGAIEKFMSQKIPVEFIEDDLMTRDRAGRFHQQRGKTYTGWPPGGSSGGRDGGNRSHQGGKGSGDGGGNRKRSRSRTHALLFLVFSSML